MSHINRFLLTTLLFVALWLGSAVIAKADTITVGPIDSNNYTFNFAIPADHRITSAVLRSTSVIVYLQSFTDVDFVYRLDGQLVGRDSIRTINPSPGLTLIHDYSFNISDLSLLQDGAAVLSVSINVTPSRSSNSFTRNNTLIIEVAQSASVPEMTTMLLLGTGLVGMIAVRRRKYKTRTDKKS